MLIWYTGHGEKETGNWVLEDGCLKFEDIYNLYKKYFKGHYLYIVTDCCYSGSWVVECARLLDRDGISCSHAVKRERIYIKVFAACLPNESAYDKFRTKCKGVKAQKGRPKTVMFAAHWKLIHEECDHSQTTLGVDFTADNGCIGGKYCHRSTWSAKVQSLVAADYQSKPMYIA